MQLTRVGQNPILTPTENWWETTNVFNAGANLYQDKVVLLYRAKGNDYLSRFGLALSRDGVNFERFPNPIFEGSSLNPYERLGVEDPRITKIDDEYLIFYTGASVYPTAELEKSQAPSLSKKAPWRIRTFLTKTKDFQTFSHGEIELHFDSKDSALFPEKIGERYALLHRIYPDMYLSYSNDLKHWHDHTKILAPRQGNWDSERVGAGPPPFKTPKGWLHFYHGVDANHIYRLGILLHDLNNPAKVIYQSDKPILVPEEEWEKQGYVPNVVFACGAVEMGGHYLIYYGGADRVVGLASVRKQELLDSLII